MLNLRQKVKQAKRQLEVIENTYYGNSHWEISTKILDRIAQEKIIDYKKKKDRLMHWKENYEIDWNKLTHISIHTDFKEFGRLRSLNGRPLNVKDINVFLDDMLKEKVYAHAKNYSEQTPSERSRNQIDYYLLVSNDKTRSKRLCIHYLYYQNCGEDVLYFYSDGNK